MPIIYNFYILGEVDISYIFCFIFRDLLTFNKAVGPGKNPKLINVRPTSIPDSRVLTRLVLASLAPAKFQEITFGTWF